MRLSTLARKIDKTPTQLITFLEGKEIELVNGLHSKLDSETVALVMSTFLPEEQISEKEIDEDQIENEEVNEEKVDGDQIGKRKIDSKQIEEKKIEKEQIEAVKKEEEKIDVEETVEMIEELPILPNAEKPEADKPEAQEAIKEQKTGTLEDLESENSDEIELIKAKKVKLDGIKVVGKIELPEKPKKEIDDPKETKVETNEVKTVEKTTKQRTSPAGGQKSVNRGFDRNRKKSPKGRNRNPLSYEEKLKKEEKEKLRKRRQIDKTEKKRKKKYYEKNIQPKITSKPKKKKQIHADTDSKPKVVVHKNPLKRLWSWLNGEYDHY